MEEIQKEQRNTLYRMEDQENRYKRKNLRIRGLPEIPGVKEELQDKMDKIFGQISTPGVGSKVKFERIHRIRKPPEIAGDVRRDIARFQETLSQDSTVTRIKNR